MVLNVSADLPFAQGRFCGAEGLTNVSNASTFRGGFGSYGVELTDGKLAGLLARAVVVLDVDGTVLHSQLVPEIAQEPNYDAAIASWAEVFEVKPTSRAAGSRPRVRPGCSATCLHASTTPGMKLALS